MKRREALQRLAILSAGVAILPGCFKEDTIFGESIQHQGTGSLKTINIKGPAAEFIQQLADVILPVQDLKFATPEPLTEFITTMLNDCHSPENIEQFGTGYKEYKTYLNKTFSNDINGLTSNEEKQLFAAIEDEKSMTENAKFFFGKMRQLALRHFTTSKKYQEEYNDFEMVPGRFNGCAEV